MDARFDPQGLACLVALADAASFGGAAERLALTPSAISQRVRALELQWGQPLVVRSRPLQFTAAGAVLLRLARQWQSLGAEAARALGSGPRRGERVPIAVNADSLATWVLPALDPLVQAGLHEGFGIDLVIDDQDFTHERLRDGAVLGCVSSLGEALQGCRVQRLGAMRYVAVASPGFVAARLPQGFGAGALPDVPMLVFDRKDGLAAAWVQAAFGLRGVRLRERHVPAADAYVEAAVRGWGVGIAPLLQVQPALDDGRLVPVRPDVSLPIALHWHQWRLGADGDADDDASLIGRIGAALRQHAARVLEA